MKRSFKERITSLGLSYQKEITILLILNLICIICCALAFYFMRQLIIVAVALIIMLIINFVYVSRYSSIERKLEKEHCDELISLMSYFEIFISNKNNVYTSLKLLLPYSSNFMQDSINSLLLQIDNDKTVAPFVTFANKFSNKVIESLMLSIYQMIDNGENLRQFDEFEHLFSTISRDQHNSTIEDKKKSLDTMSSFPLFGAGFVVVTLTLCILSVVGDMVNVI